MQAYEVSAALIVADRATAPMIKVLDLARDIEAQFTRLREIGKGLFAGTGINAFATRLERMNPALVGVTANFDAMRAASSQAFLEMSGGIDATIASVRALRTELAGVSVATRGAGVAGAIAGAAGGRGGSRDGGFHASGGIPIPMGPMDAHARFGLTPKMAAAGAVGYGLYEDVNLADAISKIIYTSGGNVGGAGYQATSATLRKQILDIFSKTGMPLADIENAAVGMTRMLAPLPLAQRAGLFNQVISAAAMESRLKGGSLEQNSEAMTGLLHQAGIYDQATIAKLLPAFTYAQLYDPATVSQMTKAASYALPVLRTTMGIDPIDTIMSVALLQSSGISSTKAGTWINSAMLGLMPGTKLLTGTSAARHMDALRTLGLVDEKGKSLFMNDKDQFMPGAAMAQMMKGLQSIPHDQWAGIFQAIAGTQGSQFLAIMSDPVVAQRGAQLLAGSTDYASRQAGFWTEYGTGSPAQDTRTAMAEFTRSLMDLSQVVLPAFTDAAKGATAVLGGVRSILEGAGIPGAGNLTSWAAVGGGALLMSSRLRGGVRTASRLGANGLKLAGLGGVLPWLGAAGAAAGLGYLDYSLYNSMKKQTGAPWYSFIPGAEFFGADPYSYMHLDQGAAGSSAPSGGGDAASAGGGGIGGTLVVALDKIGRMLDGGLTVVMDDQVVGRIVTEAQAKEGNKPPSGPSDFDPSLSPLFPTGAW